MSGRYSYARNKCHFLNGLYNNIMKINVILICPRR